MKFRELANGLQPYQPEERSDIYLALNENPYPFPQELVEETFRRLSCETLRIYYDSPSADLLSALSTYTGQPASRISIGNGADEILYYFFVMFTSRTFYICPPTYSCYAIFARAAHAKLVEIPLKGETYEKLDLEVLLRTLNENSVLLLPNPNNPTGQLFDENEIVKLLETGAFVVLDEAYFEFSDKTFVHLLDKFDNLAIVRTFSKAFSLAAQRIGYVIANEEFIEAYNAFRLPYNVSYVSQLFALVALENADIFRKRARRIVEERERVKGELRAIGLPVTDSKANFNFLPIPQNLASELHGALIANGIAVRRFREGLRVSVGTSEENDLVLSIVSEVVDRKRG